MFIQEFFVNLCILVALLFFYSQITHNEHLTRESSTKVKTIVGIFGGVLSNLLMFFGITSWGGAHIDLRHIPTIMIAYYGGIVPALLTTLLTIPGRLLISHGIASIMAIFVSIIGALFTVYISKFRLSGKIKIPIALTFHNIMFSIFFIYLNVDILFLLREIPIYWAVSYLSAFLAFYLIRYVRDSQQLFLQYEQESTTDALTGINNTRKFNRIYKNLTQESWSNDLTFALLFLDIDYFKQINDTYGHEAGDTILKELTYRMQYLSGTNAVLSRKGGEEFTILLPNRNLQTAYDLAEKIRSHTETYPFTLHSDKKIKLTVSIGVASYKETSENPHTILKDADIALYKAKEQRNKVRIAK